MLIAAYLFNVLGMIVLPIVLAFYLTRKFSLFWMRPKFTESQPDSLSKLRHPERISGFLSHLHVIVQQYSKLRVSETARSVSVM